MGGCDGCAARRLHLSGEETFLPGVYLECFCFFILTSIISIEAAILDGRLLILAQRGQKKKNTALNLNIVLH